VRAITFQGQGQVAVETVPDPTIVEPGDAVVEVTLSAVCGSDLHVYHGRERGLDAGTVMGHEFTGRVVAVGPDVRGLSRDARVASPFTTSCGACWYCRAGLTARCAAGQLFGWIEAGRGLHGAQARYVRVPLAETTLLPLPDERTDVEGLLLGDVLGTGWFCAEQAGVTPGGVYAVVGCGPVGLAALLAARELGAAALLAYDAVPERLALAQQLGAVAVDYRLADPSAPLLEATAGRGADAVLELVGSAAAHRLAYELVRPGGTISVVGVHNEERFSFSPAEAYAKNLTYRVGRCPARRMAERLLPRLGRGTLDVEPLISHRLPLERGVEAYRLFDEKRDGCIKVALDPRP